MEDKLVLHICCAPDEAWVVETLQDRYQLHCFFCNPNIHPPEEYEKRLKEAEKVAKFFQVSITADPYDSESWKEAVTGLEHTPEGGARCEQCFLLRLRRTAQFCKDLGWNRYTTVMSISPHKRIEMLNRTGEQAAREYGVIYEQFNFKKKDGFQESIRLSKELGLYRQDYCGCVLSKKESEERKRERESGSMGEREKEKKIDD
jgi:predicted adenine nucleotide alpha hydrolase (AANH) superfamily ATPase